MKSVLLLQPQTIPPSHSCTYSSTSTPNRFLSLRGQKAASFSRSIIHHHSSLLCRRALSSDADDAQGSNSEDDDGDDDESKDKQFSQSQNEQVSGGLSREDLERIVGKDDLTFSGLDLATLIRKKYGRSYDVQLVKKEFMGRNLLAMNVMWKYMEQRSFPLTEEEYLLRLDDIANTLKCWGAVSHIRNSLAKLKERPRIGKAVSIFIDMDESGGRANEWIYK